MAALEALWARDVANLKMEWYCEGCPRVFDDDLPDAGGGSVVTPGYRETNSTGWRTAIRWTRTGGGVVLLPADFTGEVSGPMSSDPTVSVNCLAGGSSYGVAQYRLM